MPPPTDTVDVSLLEPLLRQMVGLIGLPATLAIVNRYGGTLLNIPRQADANAALVDLIGAENAAVLGRALGPDRLLIPKALPALTAVRNQLIVQQLQTRSVRQVAREFRLGERMIWYIRSWADAAPSKDQPRLFD